MMTVEPNPREQEKKSQRKGVGEKKSTKKTKISIPKNLQQFPSDRFQRWNQQLKNEPRDVTWRQMSLITSRNMTNEPHDVAWRGTNMSLMNDDVTWRRITGRWGPLGRRPSGVLLATVELLEGLELLDQLLVLPLQHGHSVLEAAHVLLLLPSALLGRFSETNELNVNAFQKANEFRHSAKKGGVSEVLVPGKSMKNQAGSCRPKGQKSQNEWEIPEKKPK